MDARFQKAEKVIKEDLPRLVRDSAIAGFIIGGVVATVSAAGPYLGSIVKIPHETLKSLGSAMVAKGSGLVAQIKGEGQVSVVLGDIAKNANGTQTAHVTLSCGQKLLGVIPSGCTDVFRSTVNVLIGRSQNATVPGNGFMNTNLVQISAQAGNGTGIVNLTAKQVLDNSTVYTDTALLHAQQQAAALPYEIALLAMAVSTVILITFAGYHKLKRE